MRRVVITGLGPITSVGIGKKAFLESLQSARSGIGPVSYFDSSIFDVHSAGEIKDWIPEHYFPPHRLKRLDRYAQFAVGSAALALQIMRRQLGHTIKFAH
jgi:3-oxoacyl-[acyl-carrier-protein] synthase II